MKRKTLTMVLCLLTCLSLVGVGFASWVISSGDTDTLTGNIQVDTVTDHRFTFGEAALGTEDIIYFGMNDNTEISGAWLTNTEAKKENLTASFDITLSVPNSLTQLEGKSWLETWQSVVEFKADYAAPKNEKYTAAINTKAISAPVVKWTAVAENGTSIKYTVTITFAWGEAFDTARTTAYKKADGSETEKTPTITDNAESANLNPYAFYNAKTGENFARPVGEWGDDAYYYLDIIQQLGSLTYNVTVSATAK